MRYCLVCIGLWLARLGGWTPAPPVISRYAVVCDRVHLPDFEPAVLMRAQALTAYWGAHSVSGEGARHQVYARLQKEYPDLPARQVSLLIEAALEST